jgi:hypothetical protein
MKPGGTTRIVVSVNKRRWKQLSSFRDAGPDEPVFAIDPQSAMVFTGLCHQLARRLPSATATVRVLSETLPKQFSL